MTQVSVFLPVYKASFLAEAIRSILNQTFSDFELLVVNDASPEDIRGIVEMFADPRIIYEENSENQGKQDLVAFWNRWVQRCKGEFLVIASDDDLYAPTFLQELLLLAEKYPETDLFHCRIQYINRNGALLQIAQPAQEYETQMDFIYQRLVWKRKQTLQEFMFRRSVLIQKGGIVSFPLAWSSDSATAYLMAERGVAYTGKVLFSLRMSGSNISSTANFAAQKMEALKRSGQWLQDFLPTVHCTTPEEKFMKQEALRISKAERYASYPRYLQELDCPDFFKELRYMAQHHIFSWRARLFFVFKRLFRP